MCALKCFYPAALLKGYQAPREAYQCKCQKDLWVLISVRGILSICYSRGWEAVPARSKKLEPLASGLTETKGFLI